MSCNNDYCEIEPKSADVRTLAVRVFKMDDDKAAALKPLEEAAEIFGAWQTMVNQPPSDPAEARLADEIADCIQACCNLAARYRLDMDAAMERCEQRNRERGRYATNGGGNGPDVR